MAQAWSFSKHTGYGEAVRLIAQHVCGIDEITPGAIQNAEPTHEALLKPGGYFSLLRDRAGLDQQKVQGGMDAQTRALLHSAITQARSTPARPCPRPRK